MFGKLGPVSRWTEQMLFNHVGFGPCRRQRLTLRSERRLLQMIRRPLIIPLAHSVADQDERLLLRPNIVMFELVGLFHGLHSCPN